MCCRAIKAAADGVEEEERERTAWLGEEACLVCVTKAKAFQEF